MAKDLLATLNCDSAILSADNIGVHLQFLKQAIRDRTQLIAAMGYGIVDTEDPRYLVSGNVKSLWPDFTPQTYTKVVVSAGRAVTPAGDIVTINDSMIVDVASQTPGTESLIIARYTEEDSLEMGRTSDGVAAPVGRVPVSSIVSITKLQWLDPTITTSDVVSSSVVLGVVIWSDTDAPLLIRDLSNNYTWNRPWFSPTDTYHRSLVGTGTVSSVNPHGLGLSDLTVGSRTLYDQLTSTGLVLSKDHGVPCVPGYFCYDVFDIATIQRDNTGEKTRGSWFSGFNTAFVDLSAYPNTIVAAYGNGVEVAIDLVAGTKRCVIVADPVPTSLTVYYTKTPSLTISSISGSSVVFSGIDSNDMVVTGGQARTTALTTVVPLRKFGAVPREITFKLNQVGQIFMDPSVLAAPQSMQSTAGTEIYTNVTLPAPGRIGVGVSGMPAIQTAFAAVTVTGLGTDGSAQTETLTFDSSNWSDAAVPAKHETPTQVHYTTQVFASLSSILVRNDDSYPLIDVSTATFVVISKQDNSTSKLARLATCFWDGQEVTSVKDARRVLTTVTDGVYGYTSIHQTAEIMPGVEDIVGAGSRVRLILAEDFQQPVYLNATNTEWDGIGLLDVPVLTGAPRSDLVQRCYRSRAVPMKTDAAAPLCVYVRLFGTDTSTATRGSVRVVGYDMAGNKAEGLLYQMSTGDGADFVGYSTRSWTSVAFVISGKCRGFAAYFVRPSNTTSYMMEMV